MKCRSLVIVLCALVLPGKPCPAEAPGKRSMNILFIAVDDLRPELGCYGNPVVKTPNIDRLAGRGLVFNRAYCQQAVCSPSRSSLMTSRRPDATRVYDLVTHFRDALPDVVTLPQYFKANGYYCAALGKIYHVGIEDGPSWSEPHWYPSGQTVDTDSLGKNRVLTRVAPGVEEYTAASKAASKAFYAKHKQGVPLEDNDKAPVANPRHKFGAAFEVSPKSDDELPDGCTAAEAVKRLHELKVKDRPFFLGVGFLKPHLGFVAPRKYWDLYDPDKIPLPAIGHLPDGAPEFAGTDNGELHTYYTCPRGNPIPAAFAKELRHGYYACVSYTDAQVGRLLAALEKEGLAGNTIVVLWGDHGYQLGDHGLWCKHTNFELATRAPLIISVPGQKTAGQKCDSLVEFVDVYPTLADLCGLPIPSALDGVSLKPLFANTAASVNKVAISQYPRDNKLTGGRSLMGYSIRDERWRLTLWRDRDNAEIVATELYDEKNDSAEISNLADKPENKTVVETLSKYLSPPPQGPGKKAADQSGSVKIATKKRPTDRAALFEKKDTHHDGKLSREEFLADQRDPAAAKTRFEQWDTDKDGFLSREEFIGMGDQKPAGSATSQPSSVTTNASASAAAFTPVVRTTLTNWMDRHMSFVAEAKAGGIDLLFLGDSITDRWRTVGSNVWNKFYAPRHAANFGIGGDRTQHVLWRIEHGELDGLKPKVIVLMIGTNNSNSDDPDAIAQAIKLIVADLRAKCPDSKVLLLGIFPRNKKTDKQHQMEKIRQVNTLITQLDDAHAVHFLNINEKLLGTDGYIHSDVTSDLLHPKEKGYQIWADAMEPTLSEMLR